MERFLSPFVLKITYVLTLQSNEKAEKREEKRDCLKESVSRHSIMLKFEIPKVGITFVDCLELISFHFGAQLMFFCLLSVSVIVLNGFFQNLLWLEKEPQREKEMEKNALNKPEKIPIIQRRRLVIMISTF